MWISESPRSHHRGTRGSRTSQKGIPINHYRNTYPKRKQKTHYNSLRNTIEHFRTHIVNRTQSQQNQEATVPVKWQEKYRALLSFDFEAAVFLSHWDALPSIIEESSSFADSKLCAVFLDSILSAEAPIGEMVRVVMVRVSPTLPLHLYSIS